MSKGSGKADPPSSGSEHSILSQPSTSSNGAVPLHGHLWEEEPEAMDEQRPESAEGAGDERSRRIIRNQYRELIHSVQRKAAVR